MKSTTSIFSSIFLSKHAKEKRKEMSLGYKKIEKKKGLIKLLQLILSFSSFFTKGGPKRKKERKKQK